MSNSNLLGLGIIIGVIVAGLTITLLKPTTYLLAFTEDHASIVKQFQNRGDCLVYLEQQPQTQFKQQCWSIPDATTKN